jgi:hypothetical protein
MFIEELGIETVCGHDWSVEARKSEPNTNLVPPDGLRYERVIGGSVHLYRRATEVHFVGSPRYPQGVPIGVCEQLSQAEIGPPFATHSIMDVSPTDYRRLKAMAYERVYLSGGECKELSREREQARLQRDQREAASKGGTDIASMVHAQVAAAIGPLAERNAQLQVEIDKLKAPKPAAKRGRPRKVAKPTRVTPPPAEVTT